MVVVGVDLIELQFIYPETEAACKSERGERGSHIMGSHFEEVSSSYFSFLLPLSLGRLAQDIGTVPTIERISMLARGRANVPHEKRAGGGGAGAV